MSMTDPIADMLTRIRNSQGVEKLTVTMPSSKIKREIAKVLESEGYIKSFEVITDEKNKAQLKITLKYYNGRPVIEQLTRVSRPGLRKYSGVHDIPKIWNDLGICIISTSKGIMTDKNARKQGHGGEVLCYVA